MIPRHITYRILAIVAILSAPFIIFVAGYVGFMLDFATTWGSNFNESSMFMFLLPGSVLVGYGYLLYWLQNRQATHYKRAVIVEYKQTALHEDIDSAVTIALRESPGASIELLHQKTGLAVPMIIKELSQLEQSKRVKKSVSFNKAHYTLLEK